MSAPGKTYAGTEALEPKLDIRTIVHYPYSSNISLIDGEPVPELSRLSQASIDAAAVTWQAHPQARIVLIGESCYGDDLPDTTDLMIARGRTQGVPEDAFVPIHALPDGRPLNNTYSQTEALAHYIEGTPDGSDTALVLALSYHLRRVAHRQGLLAA